MRNVMWILPVLVLPLAAQDREREHKPAGDIERIRQLIEAEEYNEAIRLAEEGMKRQPDEGIWYALRAVARGKSGDEKGAEEDWKKAKACGFDKDPMRRPERSPRPEGPPRGAPGRDPDRSSGEGRRDEKEMFAFLKEVEPQTMRLLEQLKKEGRMDEYERVCREAWGRFQHMRELKRHNPEEFQRLVRINQMEAGAWELAEKIRRAQGGEEKTRLREELKAALEKLFELREEQRKREVEELQRRLEELKAQLEKRRQNKAAIVEKRLKQMLGESDDMDW